MDYVFFDPLKSQYMHDLVDYAIVALGPCQELPDRQAVLDIFRTRFVGQLRFSQYAIRYEHYLLSAQRPSFPDFITRFAKRRSAPPPRQFAPNDAQTEERGGPSTEQSIDLGQYTASYWPASWNEVEAPSTEPAATIEEHVTAQEEEHDAALTERAPPLRVDKVHRDQTVACAGRKRGASSPDAPCSFSNYTDEHLHYKRERVDGAESKPTVINDGDVENIAPGQQQTTPDFLCQWQVEGHNGQTSCGEIIPRGGLLNHAIDHFLKQFENAPADPKGKAFKTSFRNIFEGTNRCNVGIQLSRQRRGRRESPGSWRRGRFWAS